MIPAPILENEKDRFEALLALCILDTEPESDFDEITRMASEICGTKVALITLVADDRQWFKSKVGFEAQEGPRETSFCGHAIHSEGIFVIEDARTDDRFHDNPAVTSESPIIFYAGAPLRTTDGHAIGSLCVADHFPRTLSDEQRNYLAILSKQVVARMELQKALRETRNQYRELQELSRMVIKKQKLATIGEIASGVAHEINNPLAVLMGRSEMLKDFISNNVPKETILEIVGKSQDTIGRIADIVMALKIVSDTSLDNFKDVQSIERAFHLELAKAKKTG